MKVQVKSRSVRTVFLLPVGAVMLALFQTPASSATLQFNWTVQDIKTAFDATNGAGESMAEFALYDLYARPVLCSEGQPNCASDVSILQAVSPTFSGPGGFTSSRDDWDASVDTFELKTWAHFFDIHFDVVNYGHVAFITDHPGEIDFSLVPDPWLEGQTHANTGGGSPVYYNIPNHASFFSRVSTSMDLPSSAVVRWTFSAFGFKPGADKWEQFTFHMDSSPTPEPSTWGLMICGLSVVGCRLSQRSRKRSPEKTFNLS
jgi:hypothetical protein